MAKEIHLELSDEAINELLDMKEHLKFPNFDREKEYKQLKEQQKKGGLGCLFG